MLEQRKYVAELQVILHGVLEQFLSFGSVSILSQCMPSSKIKYNLFNKASRVVFLLHKVEGGKAAIACWQHVDSVSGACDVSALADAISYGYKELALLVDSSPKVDVLEVNSCYEDISGFIEWINEDSRLRPVHEFTQSLIVNGGEFGVGSVWLHGSLGGRDPVHGYSDFDALLVLKENTCIDAGALLELHRYISNISVNLYLYDPLQHHGLFVLTELDFKSYPEVFFPIVLFERATCIYSSVDTYRINVRSDLDERLKALMSVLNSVKVLSGLKVRLMFAYDIKALLQTVVILPILFLQCVYNKCCYKKDSLIEAKQYFTDYEWEIIDDATRLRSTWEYRPVLPMAVRRYIGQVLNPKFLSSHHRIGSVFDKRSVVKIIGTDYVEKSMRLVDAIEKKLLDADKTSDIPSGVKV